MSAKAEMLELRADAERYRWLKDQKGLSLRSDGTVWSLWNTMFSASHALVAQGVQYAPRPTLDETIDHDRSIS